MRRRIMVLGLLAAMIGVALFVRSGQPGQRIDSTWTVVSSQVNTLEVAANFTEAGGKVRLLISPNRGWIPEGPVDDVPYPHIFVFVNITSPQGDQSEYEIAYVEYSYYSIRILSSGGFSGEIDTNAEVSAEKGVVGKILYPGQYQAKIWGVLPPGGPRTADYMEFSNERLISSTVYPYRDYVYGAVALIFVGMVITGFSVMNIGSKVSRRGRTHRK